MIDKFNGVHRFLSNFYPSPIEFEGDQYPAVEHAYQAAKTDNPNNRYAISISKASDAKAMGRNLKTREDWEEVKLEIMKRLLLKKFRDPVLRQQLVDTGTEILVEGNYWHDNFWGKCACARPECSNTGKNWLGELLMQIREDISYKIAKEVEIATISQEA